MSIITLTRPQLAALRAYAHIRGWTWRWKLVLDWFRKTYTKVPSEHWPHLQILQALGWSWLSTFTFTKRPLPSEKLNELLEFLEKKTLGYGCDHDFFLVEFWLCQQGLGDQAKDLISWLKEFGATCACKVLKTVPRQ